MADINTNEVLGYLGALTINGNPKNDADVSAIITAFSNTIKDNYPEKLWSIRMAQIVANSLECYSDRIPYLNNEYKKARATLPLPILERKFKIYG